MCVGGCGGVIAMCARASVCGTEMDHLLSAPEIKIPCFPMAPQELQAKRKAQQQLLQPNPSSGTPDQWGSVTIQYGRLTKLQFASVCANTCMLRGNTTVCTQPVAPLRCAEIVQRGLGADHHLVCVTLSEFDAVQSTSYKLETKLFVTANAQSVQRWGVSTSSDALANGTVQELEKKWHLERGPGWPQDTHIAYLNSVEALKGDFKPMVGTYGGVLGVPSADQVNVEAFTVLFGVLKKCCGAQMDPAYRKILWARQMQGAGSSIDSSIVSHGGGGDVGGRHECDAHALDEVEQRLLATAVFRKCSLVDALGKLSNFDPVLTGRYCTQAKLATMQYKLKHNDPRYLNVHCKDFVCGWVSTPPHPRPAIRAQVSDFLHKKP